MNRLPDDRDMDQLVRGWMREEDERPADRNRQVGRIMGRVDETRQRRGAWRFLPFGRGKTRVDRDDEDLFVAGGGAVSMRRGVSSAMTIAAVAVLIVIAAAFVALVPRPLTMGPGAPLPAATSIDELVGRHLRAWNGEPELLSEVYAPDGVHTATYYDRTTEYVGPEQIALVAGSGRIELIAPYIEIPAEDGELRWASFSSLGGGTACLLHALDGQIVRHDCLVPETSNIIRALVGLADAETSAAIDEVRARLNGSWGPDATVERLAEVYAPDAVHSARYLNTTRTYDGVDEILQVARRSLGVTPIGERVDFEAPDGELAWAEVSDVAGGSVCVFRAVDGLITRHDCVLPIKG
jgi:hypothetical protein